MSALLELIREARQTKQPAKLVAAIPYASFLGIGLELEGDALIGKMAYSGHLIGNAALPALHGGTIGALLESMAIFTVLLKSDVLRVPKTINITVEYLRSGRPLDTFASAELTKVGRRIANVRSTAWQEDRAKPIAIGNLHILLGTPLEATGHPPTRA